RFLDRDGKELSGGLRAAELTEGAEVTLPVQRDGDGPAIKAIRLGAGPPAGRDRAIQKVDTSGMKPLPELGSGQYHGFPGGLYPEGKNTRPAAHEKAGVALA